MTLARPPEAPASVHYRQCQSVTELELLGGELSLFVRPGMAILLKGDLGSGKSTLARAMIRALSPADDAIEVPSPTFTLIQSYDDLRVPVLHADLYRVRSEAELSELGFDDRLSSHLTIVEWPELIMEWTWADVLLIEFSGHGSIRDLQLTARGAWIYALQRNTEINAFIESGPWRGAVRSFLEGDASFRRYETLNLYARSAIVMDMPARPDGPPVRHGKSYSAIAHLAEDIRAVVAINTQLCAMDYSAPRIETCNVGKGLAIIEDLGRKVYGNMIRSGDDMREPMLAAVSVLADIAHRDWPQEVRCSSDLHYRLSVYDLDALMIEVDLLVAWFWPHAMGREIDAAARAEFDRLWRQILPLAIPSNPVWTLRDYHSPNLIWLPDRDGLRRVGLIDTQDCVLGHAAYDLASLLQDARVDIAFEWADELFDCYCQLRSAQGLFDRATFEASYAALGAQRATKILGIFARLSKRDGKHGYLRHIPRVSRYLERNLQHPILEPLRIWFERHLPVTVRERAP